MSVERRTGDLSRRPCGYGNERSRIPTEIDDRLRTSLMIARHPQFRVHRVDRTCILRDVETHAAQVVRRCVPR